MTFSQKCNLSTCYAEKMDVYYNSFMITLNILTQDIDEDYDFMRFNIFTDDLFNMEK